MLTALRLSQPRRPSLGQWVWAAVLALALLLLALRAYPGTRAVPRALELSVYIALLAKVASSHALRSVLLGVGPVRLTAVGGFVALALATQVGKARDHGHYPLYVWYMYAHASPPAAFYRFEARYRSGRVGNFPFGALAPGRVGPFKAALIERVRYFAPDLRGDAGATAQRRRAQWPVLGQALAAAYNRRHPADPVQAVRVSRCDARRSGDPVGDAVACVVIHTLTVR